MDHVVPLVRGGKSTKGNAVPACKDCNNRKKYLLPLEWDQYIRCILQDATSAGAEHGTGSEGDQDGTM